MFSPKVFGWACAIAQVLNLLVLVLLATPLQFDPGVVRWFTFAVVLVDFIFLVLVFIVYTPTTQEEETGNE